jgi:hypothetical protein
MYTLNRGILPYIVYIRHIDKQTLRYSYETTSYTPGPLVGNGFGWSDLDRKKE